jgi:hypothetical protein
VTRNFSYDCPGTVDPEERAMWARLGFAPPPEFYTEKRPLLMSGEETIKKPPLGCMPRRLHLEDRIIVLLDAIGRHIKSERRDAELMVEWAEELADRLREYRRCYSEDQQKD